MFRRPLPEDLAATLERTRREVEALARASDALQDALPDTISTALRDGLHAEAAPLATRLAEVKGLTNGAIRRLERIETDLLAERHARIDDLALLVDLITGGWRGLNERLDRIEAALAPREAAGDVVELRETA